MSGYTVKIQRANCVHHTKSPSGEIKAIRIKSPTTGLQWVPFWAVSDNSPVWHTGDVGDLILDYDFAKEKGWVK
jgi:hypothetical protein